METIEEQQEKKGPNACKVDQIAGDDFWMIAQPEKVSYEDTKKLEELLEKVRVAIIEDESMPELTDQKNIISDELWSSINQGGRALLLTSLLFVQKEHYGNF